MAQHSRKRWAGAFAGLLMAGGLVACGASGEDLPPSSDMSWEAIQERANAQGSVRVYSVAVPAQNDALVEAFNEKYPDIDVQMERGALELPGRVEAEIAGNVDGADVFLYFSQQWHADHGDALLDISDLPSAANWTADQWASPGKAPVIGISPSGFITWNSEIFPEGFEDWPDLLDTSVAGKLGIRDVMGADTASFFDFLTETQGPDYLDDLAAQNPKFYPSVVPMTQAVASGEIGVSVLSTVAMAKEMKAQGAPVEYVIPEKAWASVYPAGALAHSKRPDAARVFMEFVMSEEGQAAFNGGGLAASYLPDVPDTIDLEGFSILDSAAYPPEVVEEWGRKFDQIFRS